MNSTDPPTALEMIIVSVSMFTFITCLIATIHLCALGFGRFRNRKQRLSRAKGLCPPNPPYSTKGGGNR